MDDRVAGAEELETGLSAVDGAIRAAFEADGSESVLARLPATAPRVLLRDLPGEATPVLTPASRGEVSTSERFQVVGEIARGGVGAIYKVRDLDLGRDVAWKVLQPRHKDRPQLIQRFVEEAQIGGQLQHPGIVPVYDVGLQDDQRPYISMKLVKGTTLSSLLSDRSNPSEDRERFLRLHGKICETMAYAHARGVIHRDLKPANVMVGAFGEVQIVDWGFAKVLGRGGIEDERRANRERADVTIVETVRSGSAGSDSVAGSVFGTPAYMPPEQALGEIDRLDERSDVFALGAILCEILTGAPPYVEGEERVIVQAARGRLDEAYERLDRCSADRDVVALTKRCLSPERRNRPADAGQLDKLFAGVLEQREQRRRDAEIETARANARAEEAQRARKKTLALATAGCAALLLAGVGFLLAQRSSLERERQTSRLVGTAIDRASTLGHEARSAVTLASAPWAAAIAAAEEAVDLAHREHADADTVARAERRLDELRAANAAAERKADAVAADQRLRQSLMTFRQRAMSDALYDSSQVQSELASALSAYGIELERQKPDEVVAAMGAGALFRDVRLGLDRWRLLLEPVDELRARIDLVLATGDPDPWRARLRAAAGAERSLLSLAGDLAAMERPPEDLHLLADAIGRLHTGEEQNAAMRKHATEFLARARQRYPEDGWLARAYTTWCLGQDIGALDLNEVLAASLVAKEQLGDDPLLRYVRAKARFAAGDAETSVVALRALASEHPELGAVKGTLYDLLAVLGDRDLDRHAWSEARDRFRLAAELFEDRPEAWRGLAVCQVELKESDEALACARRAEACAADEFRTQQVLSNVLWRCALQGERPALMEAATQASQQAVALARTDDERYRSLLSLGDTLRHGGSALEAARTYRKAAEIRAERHNPWFGMGMALSNARHYDEALEAFDQGVQLAKAEVAAYRAEHPGEPVSPGLLRTVVGMHTQRARVLRGLGRHAESVADAQAVLDLAGENPDIVLHGGTLLQVAGAHRQALEAFGEVIRLKPDLGCGYQHRAQSLLVVARETNDRAAFLQAAEDMRAAAKLGRGLTMRLVEAYLGAGEMEQAQSALATILRTDQISNLEVLLGEARAHGQHLMERDILEELVLRSPEHPDFLCRAAYFLVATPEVSLRDPIRAELYAQRAIRHETSRAGTATARLVLAAASLRQDRIEDAKRGLHETVEAGLSEDLVALGKIWLVLAHYQEGDEDRARALFAEVSDFVPSREDAATLFALVLREAAERLGATGGR